MRESSVFRAHLRFLFCFVGREFLVWESSVFSCQPLIPVLFRWQGVPGVEEQCFLVPTSDSCFVQGVPGAGEQCFFVPTSDSCFVQGVPGAGEQRVWRLCHLLHLGGQADPFPGPPSKYIFFTTAGHASRLPRQCDHVCKPKKGKLLYYVYIRGYSIQHRGLFQIFSCH